ncbi:DUF4235 domain-containing protein [uncultured Rothia sp.]|uniref:DUF4235 domain-containing protein n=1 Tax=uncultured Rothia sp. TaxID=316088 RepID=UPI00321654BF
MNPIQLAGTAASLAGVALANKALSASWKKVTGNNPPDKNPDEEERWRDIIIWSIITGTVGTVIKVAVSRKASQIEAQRAGKDLGQAEI